jgi:hypothetical protein
MMTCCSNVMRLFLGLDYTPTIRLLLLPSCPRENYFEEVWGARGVGGKGSSVVMFVEIHRSQYRNILGAHTLPQPTTWVSWVGINCPRPLSTNYLFYTFCLPPFMVDPVSLWRLCVCMWMTVSLTLSLSRTYMHFSCSLSLSLELSLLFSPFGSIISWLKNLKKGIHLFIVLGSHHSLIFTFFLSLFFFFFVIEYNIHHLHFPSIIHHLFQFP